MKKQINMGKIMDIVTVLLTVALIVSVLYTGYRFITEFEYAEHLGIYWTQRYSFTVSDYLEFGEAAIRYKYTHLNFYEIMKLIW